MEGVFQQGLILEMVNAAVGTLSCKCNFAKWILVFFFLESPESFSTNEILESHIWTLYKLVEFYLWYIKSWDINASPRDAGEQTENDISVKRVTELVNRDKS